MYSISIPLGNSKRLRQQALKSLGIHVQRLFVFSLASLVLFQPTLPFAVTRPH